MKKLLLCLLLPLSLLGATRVDPLMVFTDGRVANYTNLFRANSNSIVSAIGGRTVTPKLFGAVGDDSTDDTVALNAAILWGSQNKTPIVITEGRYRYSSPLLVHDNTTLISEPNGILRPNISGSDSTFTYSFLRNTNLFSGIGPTPRTSVAALATNITLRGLRFEAVAGSSTNVFGVTLIGAHNVVMEDIEIDRTFGAWAFTIYAQDLRASKLRVKSNQAIFEDGIHVLGGERLVFSDCQIQSGDDSLAIGWDASDVFARDILFNNITVKSYRAFPIKMFAPPEMTAGVTVQEKVIFNNITGEGGINRNGGIFLYEQGTPRGAITNITVSNVKLRVNSGTHDGTNPYGVWTIGGSDLKFNDVTIGGARSYQAIIQYAKGPIQFNNCNLGPPGNTNTETLYLQENFSNAVTVAGTTVRHPYYRPVRAIESDLVVNGGEISSGGSMHIGFQTATNSVRTLRVTDASLTGTSTTPVAATGAASILKTFIFTGNVPPAGSAVTGISATNFKQHSNPSMQAYDQLMNLEVNLLSVTNLSGSGAFQLTNTAPVIDITDTDGPSGVRVRVQGGDENNMVRFQRRETDATNTTHSFGTNGSASFVGPFYADRGFFTNELRASRVELGSSSFTIRSGTGTPEGVITSSVGSLFLRTDGGAGTTLYVKESGTGNTGWVAK